MLEDASEVQEALGRTYGMPEIDEDELEGQLDALLDDMALVWKLSIFEGVILKNEYFWMNRMTTLHIWMRQHALQKPLIANPGLTALQLLKIVTQLMSLGCQKLLHTKTFYQMTLTFIYPFST